MMVKYMYIYIYICTWALCFSTWLTSEALLVVVVVVFVVFVLDEGDLVPCSIPWRMTDAPRNLLSNARASMSSSVSPLSTTETFLIRIDREQFDHDVRFSRKSVVTIYPNQRFASWSKRPAHRSLSNCCRGTTWDRRSWTCSPRSFLPRVSRCRSTNRTWPTCSVSGWTRLKVRNGWKPNQPIV